MSGVFWLTTPSNWFGRSGGTQVSGVSLTDSSLLQSGAIVERTFQTAPYPAGTTLPQLQQDLVSQFNSAQAIINQENPPFAGVVGLAYDGTTWSQFSQTPQPSGLSASQIQPPTMLARYVETPIYSRLDVVIQQLNSILLVLMNALGAPAGAQLDLPHIPNR